MTVLSATGGGMVGLIFFVAMLMTSDSSFSFGFVSRSCRPSALHGPEFIEFLCEGRAFRLERLCAQRQISAERTKWRFIHA